MYFFFFDKYSSINVLDERNSSNAYREWEGVGQKLY